MLYAILLVAHSLLRWLVLAVGAAAIAQALVGLVARQDWGRRHKLSNLAFLISMDLQLVLGLVLYAGVSPLMQGIFSDFGAAMKNGDLRFWAVEHITGMVLSVVLMHVGYFAAKRARQDARKHLWGLILFGCPARCRRQHPLGCASAGQVRPGV